MAEKQFSYIEPNETSPTGAETVLLLQETKSIEKPREFLKYQQNGQKSAIGNNLP